MPINYYVNHVKRLLFGSLQSDIHVMLQGYRSDFIKPEVINNSAGDHDIF